MDDHGDGAPAGPGHAEGGIDGFAQLFDGDGLDGGEVELCRDGAGTRADVRGRIVLEEQTTGGVGGKGFGPGTPDGIKGLAELGIGDEGEGAAPGPSGLHGEGDGTGGVRGAKECRFVPAQQLGDACFGGEPEEFVEGLVTGPRNDGHGDISFEKPFDERSGSVEQAGTFVPLQQFRSLGR